MTCEKTVISPFSGQRARNEPRQRWKLDQDRDWKLLSELGAILITSERRVGSYERKHGGGEQAVPNSMRTGEEAKRKEAVVGCNNSTGAQRALVSVLRSCTPRRETERAVAQEEAETRLCVRLTTTSREELGASHEGRRTRWLGVATRVPTHPALGPTYHGTASWVRADAEQK